MKYRIEYSTTFKRSYRLAQKRGLPMDELNGVVRTLAEGAGRYSLDLTSRPQATYLLTLTTADGKQHTIRLLKQSDIFSR